MPGVKEGPRGDLEVAAKLGHFPVPENILGEEKEHLKGPAPVTTLPARTWTEGRLKVARSG